MWYVRKLKNCKQKSWELIRCTCLETTKKNKTLVKLHVVIYIYICGEVDKT